MGIFDQITGALSGGGAGDPQGEPQGVPQEHAGIAGALLDMLSGHGGGAGLGGLVQAAQQQGLGSVVASWIGTGRNLPISPEQISQVLGSEQVRSMAAKAGISPDMASSILAKMLPMVVDRATPTGEIPPQGSLLDGLGSLRKTFGV